MVVVAEQIEALVLVDLLELAAAAQVLHGPQLHLQELQTQAVVAAGQVSVVAVHSRVAMVDLALSLFDMQTQLELLHMH